MRTDPEAPMLHAPMQSQLLQFDASALVTVRLHGPGFQAPGFQGQPQSVDTRRVHPGRGCQIRSCHNLRLLIPHIFNGAG